MEDTVTYSIYRLTNKVNGKVYIGVTNNLKKRMREHSYALNDYLISKAIRKYGWESFTCEVIDQTNIEREAYEVLEPRHIAEHHSNDPSIGYNLTEGGQGMTGYVFSEETRRKMREAKIGKKQDSESIRKRAESLKGRTVSKDTRRKISEKLKGNQNFSGKTVSEDHRRKIGDANAKEWVFIDPSGNEIRFHNLRKFCEERGLNHVCMFRVSKGQNRSHKGYRAVHTSS